MKKLWTNHTLVLFCCFKLFVVDSPEPGTVKVDLDILLDKDEYQQMIQKYVNVILF